MIEHGISMYNDVPPDRAMHTHGPPDGDRPADSSSSSVVSPLLFHALLLQRLLCGVQLGSHLDIHLD